MGVPGGSAMAAWEAFWNTANQATTVPEWLALGLGCPECGAPVRDMTRDTQYEDIRLGWSDRPVRTALAKDEVRLVPCGHTVPWQVLHPQPEPTPLYDAVVAERRAAAEQAEEEEAWALVEPLLTAPAALTYLRFGVERKVLSATLADAITGATVLEEDCLGIPQRIDVAGYRLPWSKVSPAAARAQERA